MIRLLVNECRFSMAKKTVFTVLVILSVLIIIRPREKTLLRCAMFGSMKFFSSYHCMTYFEVFGYSEGISRHLSENFDVSSLLNLGAERKYYFSQLYLDSGNDINMAKRAMPIHGAILKITWKSFIGCSIRTPIQVLLIT